MSLQDVYNVMLPPVTNPDGTTTNPHMTSPFGRRRPTGPHGGYDFNYEGGQQNPLNQSHPLVYSPVSGDVEAIGGDYNRVVIRDSDGNTHEILHLDTITVGDYVNAGESIGTMGGYGPNGPNSYDQHIHYQMHDPDGDLMNPLDFWNNRSPEVGGSSDTPLNIDFDDILNPFDSGLFDGLHDLFNSGELQSSSPLILDLDNDGVETTGVGTGAYFDLDGNGFAERTGWAAPDDGLLVMDRNSNGTIDNGGELFGNETLQPNNTGETNGFYALAELDSNADGIIDATDTAWSQLKIWQDANGDGYSTAAELHTLDEVGIQSLNLGYTSSATYDEQGNGHFQLGSFTKTDNTTGAMEDVWFNVDRADTIVEEWLDVPPAIAALPDVRGYGNVYDLQQAMVRDASGELQSLVEQFAAATDITTRNGLMDQILFKWTGSDGVDPASRGEYFDARKLAVMEKMFGETFSSQFGPDPIPNAVPWLEQAYQGLSEMFYAQFMAQTHLKDLCDHISYSWDEATQSLKGSVSAVITEIQNQLNADADAGRQTLSEFTRILKGFGAEGMISNLSDYRAYFASQSAELGGLAGAIVGTSGDDYYVTGSSADDVLFGYAGSDALAGEDGHDLLVGGTDNDTLSGGEGNDTLQGGEGDNTLLGNFGDDVLSGGSGNDLLCGGNWNSDWSYNITNGNDTYLFGRGSGQDGIIDYDTTAGNIDTIQMGADIAPADVSVQRSGNSLQLSINGTSDVLSVGYWFFDGSGSGQIEQVRFADGTIWDAAAINQMVLNIHGTSGDDYLVGYETAETIQGNEGNDQIYAYAGDDAVDGGTGNDNLSGGDGNDSLQGGAGDDWLQGDEGNDVLQDAEGSNTLMAGFGDDTLAGGSGNDTLYGGNGTCWDYSYSVTNGNDTYLFGRGSGQDSIFDYDTAAGNLDTIQLGAGITPADVTVQRNGDSLLLSINGTTDTLSVQNWFAGEVGSFQVEQIQFADATVWDAAAIKQMVLNINGTAGDDYLVGYETAETIQGDDGSDSIYSYAGDDTIDGGAGDDALTGGVGNDAIQGGTGNDVLFGDADNNSVQGGDDTLSGGAGDDLLCGGNGTYWDYVYSSNTNGNDTYQFGRGSGQDSIFDYDTVAGNIDTIQLAADVTPADVTVQRSNSSLVLSINGTTDTLTVQYWFGDEAGSYQVERIQFADATVWDAAAINQMVLNINGTAGDDYLVGYETAEIIQGNAGNDSIYSYAGEDTIDGGAGSDVLYGGDGNDTLLGGAGDDYLMGETGNDTYMVGLGSGQDTILDYDTTAGNADTVNFDVNRLDVILSQSGNNLVMTMNGTTDQVTVQNWYYGAEYQTEAFQTADGSQLVNSQVDQLIQAMASFCSANGMTWGEAIQQRPTETQQVLAQYWTPQT